MRNSPINHLRHHHEQTESPYRIVQNRSAARESYTPDRVLIKFTQVSGDIEYWIHRTKTAEAEVAALREELHANRLQLDDIEDKVGVLVSQNNHLSDEN